MSPFLNFDFPAGNKDQMFDLTKDFTLKDSCPCKISTSIFPFLVVLNLLFANLAEGVLVFRAVQEAVDISLIPLAVQAIGVLTHFRVVSRCATEKMAEGQLDVAVSRAVIKEAAAVQVAFGNAAHQLTDADFTELELRLFDDLPLAVHHVSVAKHLLVHSTDDLFFPGVLIAWDQLEGGFTLLREAFDP